MVILLGCLCAQVQIAADSARVGAVLAAHQVVGLVGNHHAGMVGKALLSLQHILALLG